MQIQKISVQHLRSYNLFTTELDSNITLILGDNGTGKTTLLEAIYFLLQGTTFRGKDFDVISHKEKRTTFLLKTTDEDIRRCTLDVTSDGKCKKVFTLGDKTTSRLLKNNRYPVILFEPEELRLISSSPEKRRGFFDGILSRLDSEYASNISRYKRTLLQRNELLKKREELDVKVWNDHLFAWDLNFSELATKIYHRRQELINLVNENLSEIYSSIAENKNTIKVQYATEVNEKSYQQNLFKTLENSRVADSYRGYTTSGIHRDDFLVYLNSHLASQTASRGEMRTTMLSFKLLEIELQKQITGKNPIILMDDVFSELDSRREQKLINQLSKYQTIITATDVRETLLVDAKIINL